VRLYSPAFHPSFAVWDTVLRIEDGKGRVLVPVGKWGRLEGFVEGELGQSVLELRTEKLATVKSHLSHPAVRLGGVPAGSYILGVARWNGVFEPISAFRVEDGRTTDIGTVMVPGRAYLEVYLNGRAEDTDGAEVQVSSGSGPAMSIPYASAQWPAEVPAGNCRLTVRGPAILMISESMDLHPGEVHRVVLDTVPAARLDVSVVFAAPAEVSDIDIQAVNQVDGLSIERHLSALEGKTALSWSTTVVPGVRLVSARRPSGTPCGEQEVDVRGRRRAGCTIEVSVKHTTDVPVELVFEAPEGESGARLSFIVRDMDARPVTEGVAWPRHGHYVQTCYLPAGVYHVDYAMSGCIARSELSVDGTGPSRVVVPMVCSGGKVLKR
jgi:hypothetical protein